MTRIVQPKVKRVVEIESMCQRKLVPVERMVLVGVHALEEVLGPLLENQKTQDRSRGLLLIAGDTQGLQYEDQELHKGDTVRVHLYQSAESIIQDLQNTRDTVHVLLFAYVMARDHLIQGDAVLGLPLDDATTPDPQRNADLILDRLIGDGAFQDQELQTGVDCTLAHLTAGDMDQDPQKDVVLAGHQTGDVFQEHQKGVVLIPYHRGDGTMVLDLLKDVVSIPGLRKGGDIIPAHQFQSEDDSILSPLIVSVVKLLGHLNIETEKMPQIGRKIVEFHGLPRVRVKDKKILIELETNIERKIDIKASDRTATNLSPNTGNAQAQKLADRLRKFAETPASPLDTNKKISLKGVTSKSSGSSTKF